MLEIQILGVFFISIGIICFLSSYKGKNKKEPKIKLLNNTHPLLKHVRYF